jgi:FMN phosphatase YigB (HAD superfamily)
MIRAVVFDCFGVLCYDGWLPFRDKYFSHDPDLMQQAINLDHESDAGRLPYEIFLNKIASLANIDRQSAKEQIETNPSNPAVFSYIQDTIVGNYAVGLLSNAAENWLSNLFTPDQLKVFDATAISCEIGFAKPSPSAYHAIANKLFVDAKDCVLIDDQTKFCEGAVAVGMQAIQFIDIDQTAKALNTLLAVNMGEPS